MFTIAASGTAPLSYQWLKNGAVIPGATQDSYQTPGVTLADSGSSFSVTISNTRGTVTSSPAILTVTSSRQSDIRFVSPTGSDSRSGAIDQPYRTIQHCATTVPAGWTCEVRAGTYRETITPNSGVTITSYNLESVVVDGSDPVSGWSPDQNGIYKANVSLSSDDTNQIFVANEMMTEARWPNGDDLFHVNWAHEEEGTDASHIVDSKLPSMDWTGAKVHLWSGTDPFAHETGNVTTSAQGQLGIHVEETGTCPYICPVPDGFYYLFGTLGALDTAREWFYDSDATTLYFMPPGGADPNTLDVRAKRRQYAFDLRGRSNVTIRNIAIFAGTLVTDEASSNNMIDRINAKYLSHFTDLPVAPSDPDGSGYTILQVHAADSGIVLYGSHNTIENSTLAYSAGAGIALEGDGNTIRNNLIYAVDYIGDYASGINLDGDDNTIQYNTIHDAGRQGILINAVKNQNISYNNLFHAMMLSRDGAEIYACCSQAAIGTRLHHNWLHGTQSLVEGAGQDLALSGVGIDNNSGGFDVDQNLLWENQRYNVLVNGAGIRPSQGNSVHNNTIPDSSLRAGIEVSSVVDCSITHIVDNRVAADVLDVLNTSACDISNNNIHAAGANEMSTSTGVGCSFSGCSSAGPPAISDKGNVSPCPANVFARP